MYSLLCGIGIHKWSSWAEKVIFDGRTLLQSNQYDYNTFRKYKATILTKYCFRCNRTRIRGSYGS